VGHSVTIQTPKMLVDVFRANEPAIPRQARSGCETGRALTAPYVAATHEGETRRLSRAPSLRLVAVVVARLGAEDVAIEVDPSQSVDRRHDVVVDPVHGSDALVLQHLPLPPIVAALSSDWVQYSPARNVVQGKIARVVLA
jgi:hypothetical protein